MMRVYGKGERKIDDPASICRRLTSAAVDCFLALPESLKFRAAKLRNQVSLSSAVTELYREAAQKECYDLQSA